MCPLMLLSSLACIVQGCLYQVYGKVSTEHLDIIRSQMCPTPRQAKQLEEKKERNSNGLSLACRLAGAEWCGTSKRALFTILSHGCYALGLMLLSGISYGIRNWRLLQLVLSAPVCLLGVYYW